MATAGAAIASLRAAAEAIAAVAVMPLIMAVMPAAITRELRTPTDTAPEWRMLTQPTPRDLTLAEHVPAPPIQRPHILPRQLVAAVVVVVDMQPAAAVDTRVAEESNR